MTFNKGSLSGLRVIDLTQMLAGPFCTMMLADHGADVIKIESPKGDSPRTTPLGPFLDDDTEHLFGGYFQSINRNKRGLILDLRKDAAKEVLVRLVETADVLVENYRVGVMDRLELSYEFLATKNPRLVYAALRGFGDPRTGESPYATWPAYDVVAQAMGGAIGVTGLDADHPVKIGPGVGDIVPGMYLAFGILAAVRHAANTGKGQFIDVAMYDAVVNLCERTVYQHGYTGMVPHPEGNTHPFLCPFGIFKASDGWVAIAAPADEQWVRLCDLIDLSDWGRDPNMSTRSGRAARRHQISEAVTAWTSCRTKAEISSVLGGKVPFGPVNNAADIFKDPHVRIREVLAEVDHPGSKKKGIIVNTPVRMTETPGGVRHSAPKYGEHSEQVLLEVGYAPSQIAELRSSQAIR